jgi:hypothetical protein
MFMLVTLALIVLPATWSVQCFLGLLHNIAKAKATGLPYVICRTRFPVTSLELSGANISAKL